jgi:hypothetical protein
MRLWNFVVFQQDAFMKQCCQLSKDVLLVSDVPQKIQKLLKYKSFSARLSRIIGLFSSRPGKPSSGRVSGSGFQTANTRGPKTFHRFSTPRCISGHKLLRIRNKRRDFVYGSPMKCISSEYFLTQWRTAYQTSKFTKQILNSKVGKIKILCLTRILDPDKFRNSRLKFLLISYDFIKIVCKTKGLFKNDAFEEIQRFCLLFLSLWIVRTLILYQATGVFWPKCRPVGNTDVKMREVNYDSLRHNQRNKQSMYISPTNVHLTLPNTFSVC